MTQKKQIYRCNICGNIVEMLHEGAGQLVCCGVPMELLEEKTKDEGMEKHVPVIEKTTKGILVKVGSIAHPMDPNHYIEWIELIDGENVYRKQLKASDKPEALFPISADSLSAREYCSIHGLWKS